MKFCQSNCNETLSARKKTEKEVFLLLVYDMIFSSRKNHDRQKNAVKQCNQIKEFLKKLHKVKQKSVKDADWWRRGAYSEICASEIFIKSDAKTFNGIDLLLSGTDARRTFKTFMTFEGSPEQEMSLFLLDRLDAIITDMVDFLSLQLFEFETCHYQNPEESYDHTSYRNNKRKKGRSSSAFKGGKVVSRMRAKT